MRERAGAISSPLVTHKAHLRLPYIFAESIMAQAAVAVASAVVPIGARLPRWPNGNEPKDVRYQGAVC